MDQKLKDITMMGDMQLRLAITCKDIECPINSNIERRRSDHSQILILGMNCDGDSKVGAGELAGGEGTSI